MLGKLVYVTSWRDTTTTTHASTLERCSILPTLPYFYITPTLLPNYTNSPALLKLITEEGFTESIQAIIHAMSESTIGVVALVFGGMVHPQTRSPAHPTPQPPHHPTTPPPITPPPHAFQVALIR